MDPGAAQACDLGLHRLLLGAEGSPAGVVDQAELAAERRQARRRRCPRAGSGGTRHGW
jgi:hypothetical protein